MTISYSYLLGRARIYAINILFAIMQEEIIMWNHIVGVSGSQKGKYFSLPESIPNIYIYIYICIHSDV